MADFSRFGPRSTLWLANAFSDLTIQLKDGSEIQTHKILIAGYTDYLGDVLLHELGEDADTMTIDYDDVEAVRAMVSFFYSGVYPSITSENNNMALSHLRLWAVAFMAKCDALSTMALDALAEECKSSDRVGIDNVVACVEFYEKQGDDCSVEIVRAALGKRMLEDLCTCLDHQKFLLMLERYPDWQKYLLFSMASDFNLAKAQDYLDACI